MSRSGFKPPNPWRRFARGGTGSGLRLHAVMAQGAAGYAIVNGKTLFIGESLNGYRLLAVYDRSAILETPAGTRIELTLPE